MCSNNKEWLDSSCLLALVSVVVVLFSGCDSSPQKFEITGTVQVDGKPVPMAMIVMTPDRTKGNSGSQGMAEVRDGEIVQTHREMVGGPHWLEIHTFDGVAFQGEEGTVSAGKRILEPLNVQVDLPRSDVKVQIDMHKQEQGKGDVHVELVGV